MLAAGLVPALIAAGLVPALIAARSATPIQRDGKRRR